MCLFTTSTTCTSSLIFLVVFTKIYFSFVVFYNYLYSFVVSNVLQCHPLISKKAQRWYHNQRQTITLTSLLCRCNSRQRLSSLCLARLALLNSDCKWSLSFPTCQSQKKKTLPFYNLSLAGVTLCTHTTGDEGNGLTHKLSIELRFRFPLMVQFVFERRPISSCCFSPPKNIFWLNKKAPSSSLHRLNAFRVLTQHNYYYSIVQQ